MASLLDEWVARLDKISLMLSEGKHDGPEVFELACVDHYCLFCHDELMCTAAEPNARNRGLKLV